MPEQTKPETKYLVDIHDYETGENHMKEELSLKDLLRFREAYLHGTGEDDAEFRAFHKCRFLIMIDTVTYQL